MHRCGDQVFRVTGMPEENKPRNILEEIVWCVGDTLVLRPGWKAQGRGPSMGAHTHLA